MRFLFLFYGVCFIGVFISIRDRLCDICIGFISGSLGILLFRVDWRKIINLNFGMLKDVVSFLRK